jgi:tRNA (uracil-5-)-methyltransferase TRM9
LIYVWAIEQDDASKRILPTDTYSNDDPVGLDVLVPWVHNTTSSADSSQDGPQAQIYKRYYHMFAKGELQTLARQAAENLGMLISDQAPNNPTGDGISIVQEGWERSNYYIELLTWNRSLGYKEIPISD